MCDLYRGRREPQRLEAPVPPGDVDGPALQTCQVVGIRVTALCHQGRAGRQQGPVSHQLSRRHLHPHVGCHGQHHQVRVSINELVSHFVTGHDVFYIVYTENGFEYIVHGSKNGLL